MSKCKQGRQEMTEKMSYKCKKMTVRFLFAYVRSK